jgi:general stress protein 26
MPTQNPRQLSDVLRSLDTVMLTTIDQTDQLVSRPMAACVDDFAGTLWFFAPMKSRIIVNISANPKVNISYAGPLTSLSIAGTATFTPNLAKISARWHSGLNPWFPGGMDDVAMIEVAVDEARLWTGPVSSALGRQLYHPVYSPGSGRRRSRA